MSEARRSITYSISNLMAKTDKELERENKEPKAWGGLGRSMVRFWPTFKEKGRQEENGKLCLSNSGLR